MYDVLKMTEKRHCACVSSMLAADGLVGYIGAVEEQCVLMALFAMF